MLELPPYPASDEKAIPVFVPIDIKYLIELKEHYANTIGLSFSDNVEDIRSSAYQYTIYFKPSSGLPSPMIVTNVWDDVEVEGTVFKRQAERVNEKVNKRYLQRLKLIRKRTLLGKC